MHQHIKKASLAFIMLSAPLLTYVPGAKAEIYECPDTFNIKEIPLARGYCEYNGPHTYSFECDIDHWRGNVYLGDEDVSYIATAMGPILDKDNRPSCTYQTKGDKAVRIERLHHSQVSTARGCTITSDKKGWECP